MYFAVAQNILQRKKPTLCYSQGRLSINNQFLIIVCDKL